MTGSDANADGNDGDWTPTPTVGIGVALNKHLTHRIVPVENGPNNWLDDACDDSVAPAIIVSLAAVEVGMASVRIQTVPRLVVEGDDVGGKEDSFALP